MFTNLKSSYSEAAACRDSGLVCWPKVAVYKHPGKHPGDIHIFEAVGNNALHEFVGSARHVIFFSTQGSRSITDEISKSDLDGDKYLISWNTKVKVSKVSSLLPDQNS